MQQRIIVNKTIPQSTLTSSHQIPSLVFQVEGAGNDVYFKQNTSKITIQHGTEMNINTIRTSLAKNLKCQHSHIELYAFSPTNSTPTIHASKWEWLQHPPNDRISQHELNKSNLLYTLADGEKLEVEPDQSVHFGEGRDRKRLDGLLVIIKKALFN